MRAHSSPMRAYLLDAMIYCMMYARFAVACAEATLSSSLEGAEDEVQVSRVGGCRCLLQWSQGSRDMRASADQLKLHLKIWGNDDWRSS